MKHPFPEPVYSLLLDPLPPPPHWAPISEFRKQMRILAVRDEPDKQQLTGFEEDNPSKPLLVRYNLADTNDSFAPTIEALRRHFALPLAVQLINVEIDAEGFCRPRAMVLEPDYLTITAVAECFQPGGAEPLQYLLKKFLPVPVNKYLLLGHIANFFLDEFLSNPEGNFPDTFPKAFRLNPLGFSLLGRSGYPGNFKRRKSTTSSSSGCCRSRFPPRACAPNFATWNPRFIRKSTVCQGRLDIFHRDDPAASIVELKSGAPFPAPRYVRDRRHPLHPDTAVRPVDPIGISGKDQSQKLHPLFGRRKHPLRYPPRVKAQQYEALQVRNQLVGCIERQLAGTFANNKGNRWKIARQRSSSAAWTLLTSPPGKGFPAPTSRPSPICTETCR